MPKVHYIDHQDNEKIIDVPVGWSIMEGAINNDIEGIEADCGGCLSCATCHVYVDEAWLDKLSPKEDEEIEMLECTASDNAANSRLSCQLTVTEDLDGIVVRMPEFQS